MRPELEPQDVALPGEQVVADVHARHRLHVAADDVIGDEVGQFRGLVAAMLDVVERRRADLQTVLVPGVPLGDLRVEIPAVVIEPRGRGDRADLVERLVLDLAEADGDVRDLDAGVVDVVLDLDLAAEEAEQPSERVAQRGVAKVADVRRLVRVDRGVLDDRLAGAGRRGARARRAASGWRMRRDRERS